MMSPPALSPRLQTIFDLLLPGLPVWDVCCDHGYLGITALRSNSFAEVHFVDQVPSIIQKLERKLSPFLAEKPCEFHIADGGRIKSSVEGTFVIAGIGGMNMIQMLEKLLLNPQFRPARIVLAPQKDVLKLREWLAVSSVKRGLELFQENMVFERDRERFIFAINFKS